MKFTHKQFIERFPDDDACLEEIWQLRFGDEWICPTCGRQGMFTRVRKRMCYSCTCGHQIHPLAGTVFRKTTTSLRDWFYVMYLMTQTKAGISAKQIEREIGCTYKTAWRMMHQIRKLMADDEDDKLKGTVEADETFMKAKPWRDTRVSRGKTAFFAAPKVLGIVERGGRAKVRVMTTLNYKTINEAFYKMVKPGALVITDGSRIYNKLYPTYYHESHIHYGPKPNSTVFEFQPVPGGSTQNIENLWSNFKRGVLGVYRHVKPKHLQAYADEYAWRYSHRNQNVLFDVLLEQIKPKMHARGRKDTLPNP